MTQNSAKDRDSYLPVIDLVSALERTGGDLEFLKELLDLYIEDHQEKIKRLELALRSKNFPEAEGLTHTLKGSTANLGLSSLEKIFVLMEKKAKHKRFDDLEEGLTHLEQEFNRFLDYLAKDRIQAEFDGSPLF